ncbi:MAG: hypothetical protein ACFBRM_11575 [Pikeienuella sp.]
MRVRYARWFALALIVFGVLGTVVGLWLAVLAERISPVLLPSSLSVLAGLMMLRAPALAFDGTTLFQRNLLGMTLSRHRPAEFILETGTRGDRRLYVACPSGRRRRVLAERGRLYDRREAAALLDAVCEVAARARLRTVDPQALRTA